MAPSTLQPGVRPCGLALRVLAARGGGALLGAGDACPPLGDAIRTCAGRAGTV